MEKKEELIAKTDQAIAELVKEKTQLKKAYNYYNCKRDKELFKFLEENYGLGLPTAVEFVPLIRKHVDALVGEYLDVPILPKVSCKDTETINNIFRQKLLKIAEECYNLLSLNLKTNLLRFIKNSNLEDLNIKQQLDKLIEDVNDNFISEYEIAGLNIIEYIIQSRNTDLINKLRQLFVDLLVTGFTFYRTIPAKGNVAIECLSPLDVFPDLNYDSPYICDCHRIVVRKYLSRDQILNLYGRQLSKEDIANIKDTWRQWLRYGEDVLVVGSCDSIGVRAGEEVTPIQNKDRWYELIPVFEVEWLEVDKNFVMLRYKTTRIGSEIYILTGVDKDVVRTKDAPEKATLSVNGVWFGNRDNTPYSMVLNCMVLQD